MTHTHLTDDELITLCVDGSAPPLAAAGSCASCESRLVSLAGLLQEIADTQASQADAAFPPDRLTRQHARILHRIEHQGQLGRVLAFPHGRGRRTAMPAMPVRRWVAGAAAAGLAIGLIAGHYAHELPVLRARPAAGDTLRGASSVPLQTATGGADAEFLREIEAAINSGPLGLRRLDSVTPVAWEQR